MQTPYEKLELSYKEGSMQNIDREKFEEKIVNIGRVTKVVKGGRRFRFTALVVIGDKNGTIGYGTGKAKEVPDAIKKAVDDAFKSLVKVNIKGSTIAHDIEQKKGASRIILRPASEGTGTIAGGAMRSSIGTCRNSRCYCKISRFKQSKQPC